MTARINPPQQDRGESLLAGVATQDITPTGATVMSGYAARTGPSEGTHDWLSVRALVLGRTAIVTVDVVGLHEDFCAQVRASVRDLVDHVIVHATHTHSGPASVPGRLGNHADTEWLSDVAATCVEVILRAAEACEPVRVVAGYGDDPDVARNRRRPDGPVDRALPLVRYERRDGSPLALLVSYSCHPVVLNAENLMLSADYPGVVRERLERATGATALFATSCAGDLNTGHHLGDAPEAHDAGTRTFEQCDLVGRQIADAALRSELLPGPSLVRGASTSVQLELAVPPVEEVSHDAKQWAELADTCAMTNRPLYESWLRWAEQFPEMEQRTWQGRVSVLQWGSALLVALPGEPFCIASQEIRRQVAALTGVHAVLVLGYSDGCPGYFPAADEYPLGGYEVTDAHRYYGMPGPFTVGSLEHLVQVAVRLTKELVTAR